jgi:glycosyltransferase involved in cell wall biosynthesis
MVHYLPRSGLPGYLSILANIRQMRAEMIRLEPDLVHAHVAGEYAEAAAISGLPWVLTPHGIRFREVDLRRGFLDKIYRGWFVKREERRTIKRAKHLISITPFIQSTFNGQIRGKVYNIENPVPETFFNLPRNGHAGQLLFAGRLIPLKGVHTLLRAFAKLHRRLPDVTLRLAGENASLRESGPYYQELKQFVAEAGLEEVVTFLGELDQPTLLKEYANCSAVVLSSIVETSPMVIMEAMAAGKAVVSTDAGGARYLVEHGQTGLIVPVNDEQALAEALYQVLSDETKVETMGRRAREVATQRFHAKVVAARTREVYYSMLGQHPPQLSGNDHELQ